jgi:membrane fusion protein, copper/silver efflux system
MKYSIKAILLIAVPTLLVGILCGWLFFGGEGSNDNGTHNQSDAVASETIWTCSMHPQIRQSEPGDCPICGMDLIPLENDTEETDPSSIRMSEAAMQLANIQTAVVEKSKPAKSLLLSGKIQIDERNLHSQATHISGRVEALLVNFTGEFVSQGQVIARVYSPELVAAQQELFESQKSKEAFPGLFESAKEKLRNWKLTNVQIQEILKTGKALEEFPILANHSGYVTKKIATEGDYIKKGEAIYEVANLSSVWVLFDVYEGDLQWVKKGDSIKYTVQSIPGKEFAGKISFMDPVINPKTRVAKVRVQANNSDGSLKPEMFVSGTVKSGLSSNKESIVVPKSSVMWTGKRSLVYVKTGNEKGVSFRMREVTLGADLGNDYVIEKGLEEGEEIAVNGTFSIDAAAQLAGKSSMMNPEGGKLALPHQHETTSTETSEQEKDKPRILDVAIIAALSPLTKDYLEMKSSLAADDFDGAKASLKTFQSTLSKVDMKIFKGDAHNEWMSVKKPLNESLQHAKHVTGIDDLRVLFGELSTAFVSVANTFKLVDETLYIQHCPMAFDNTGADWISSDSAILNPYFGASMLKCGSVTEEIK